jgi:hypothetical protein
VSLAIANDDERREGEAASALHYLRYAVDLHDLLCEGQLRRVNSRHLSALLELKPGSPGSVCERLEAPMIFKSSAVEDDLRNAGGLRALGNEGSDFGSLLHLGALGVTLHRCIKGRGRCQGLPSCVINHLCVDVVQAAEDRESRSYS